VRAGLVQDPRDYDWSSYRVYAYGDEDGLTDIHELYELLGKDIGDRQKNYREYVLSSREKEEEELREKMGKGVLGTGEFQREIKKRAIDYRRPKRGRPEK
jgi:putative transposase